MENDHEKSRLLNKEDWLQDTYTNRKGMVPGVQKCIFASIAPYAEESWSEGAENGQSAFTNEVACIWGPIKSSLGNLALFISLQQDPGEW